MSGLDDLSQEGSPELLSDVMTKLIRDSNSTYLNIGSAEDETAATAAASAANTAAAAADASAAAADFSDGNLRPDSTAPKL